MAKMMKLTLKKLVEVAKKGKQSKGLAAFAGFLTWCLAVWFVVAPLLSQKHTVQVAGYLWTIGAVLLGFYLADLRTAKLIGHLKPHEVMQFRLSLNDYVIYEGKATHSHIDVKVGGIKGKISSTIYRVKGFVEQIQAAGKEGEQILVDEMYRFLKKLTDTNPRKQSRMGPGKLTGKPDSWMFIGGKPWSSSGADEVPKHYFELKLRENFGSKNLYIDENAYDFEGIAREIVLEFCELYFVEILIGHEVEAIVDRWIPVEKLCIDSFVEMDIVVDKLSPEIRTLHKTFKDEGYWNTSIVEKSIRTVPFHYHHNRSEGGSGK